MCCHLSKFARFVCWRGGVVLTEKSRTWCAPEFEIRISKSEANSKSEPRKQSWAGELFEFRFSNLFRVSRFAFRISASQTPARNWNYRLFIRISVFEFDSDFDIWIPNFTLRFSTYEIHH